MDFEWSLPRFAICRSLDLNEGKLENPLTFDKISKEVKHHIREAELNGELNISLNMNLITIRKEKEKLYFVLTKFGREFIEFTEQRLLNINQKNEEFNSISEILENPNLFEIINSEFSKLIVGEELTRKTIFLVACGSLVENVHPTSTNLCVNASSGSGKDWIIDNVLKIFPIQIIEKRKRISPTAFTYWHNGIFEKEWTWDGKICYLEDVSDSILNSEVMKTFSSNSDKEAKSTIVVKGRAFDYIIRGKSSIFLTTASATPNPEALRRFPIVTLDESIEQTKAIKKLILKSAKTGKVLEYDSKFTEALANLGRVKVKIPFAEKLENVIGDEHIIIRTNMSRLIDYIKFCTGLYQKQRKKDDEGYYLAEWSDFKIAIQCFKHTVVNALTIPLTRKEKLLLEVIEKEFGYDDFTVPELEPKVNFLSKKSLYTYLDERLAENFLEASRKSSDIESESGKVILKELKSYRLKKLKTLEISEDIPN